MYLVDTNVISEARKGARADPGVLAFLHDTAPETLFLAVQTLGELRRGQQRIAQRGDHEQAQRLDEWLAQITTLYRNRILDFDLDCAQVWGALLAPNPQHPIDKQIAAIALIHDLTVVTRNTKDFSECGVKLLNPFGTDSAH